MRPKVPEDAGAGHLASNGSPSRALSRVAAKVLRHEPLDCKEAGREFELHAQQSGEARLGEAAGRLAMVPAAAGRFYSLSDVSPSPMDGAP